MEAAHDCGLSYGKYRAYLELAALDPTVTPEEVQGMTMREIRDRIAALSGGTATAESAAGAPAETPAPTPSVPYYGYGYGCEDGEENGYGHHGAGHHGDD